MMFIYSPRMLGANDLTSSLDEHNVSVYRRMAFLYAYAEAKYRVL